MPAAGESREKVPPPAYRLNNVIMPSWPCLAALFVFYAIAAHAQRLTSVPSAFFNEAPLLGDAPLNGCVLKGTSKPFKVCPSKTATFTLACEDIQEPIDVICIPTYPLFGDNEPFSLSPAVPNAGRDASSVSATLVARQSCSNHVNHVSMLAYYIERHGQMVPPIVSTVFSSDVASVNMTLPCADFKGALTHVVVELTQLCGSLGRIVTAARFFYYCSDTSPSEYAATVASLFANTQEACSRTSCQNGGTCAMVNNFEYCICTELFTGTLCETEVDVCANKKCDLYQICVVDANGAASCVCEVGHSGPNCEPLDVCLSNPCRNGAQCTAPAPSAFKCDCPKGYKGSTCDEVDACAATVCANGGTCNVNADGSPICQCAPGYGGSDCTVPDPCATMVCKNGGTCVAGTSGAPLCKCPLGLEGPICEDDTRCRAAPCQNGGTCTVDLQQGVLCLCAKGYSGPTCAQAVSVPCGEISCNNGGTCIILPSGTPQCQCAPGFAGPRCTTRLVDGSGNTPTDNTSPSVTDETGGCALARLRRCVPGAAAVLR